VLVLVGLIGNTIYAELSKVYTIELEDFVAPRLSEVSLFEFIVAVMLSQNTGDENAWGLLELKVCSWRINA
jgi:endonuclease III